MSDKQSFFVQSADGRRFKMVIRGDLGRLSVKKIRRYLASYKVPEDHILAHNGVAIPEEAEGEDFGLCNDAVLHLISPRTYASGGDLGNTSSDTRLPVKSVPSMPLRAEAEKDSNTPLFGMRPFRAPSIPGGSSNTTSKGAMASHTGNTNSHVDSHFQPLYADSNALSGSNSNGLTVALEAENRQLRDEVHRLRQELTDAEQQSQRVGKGSRTDSNDARGDSLPVDLLHHAKANLQELSEELGVPLQFDMNFTSVVGTDERNTVLVTFDHATERLYVYGTILTALPENPAVRVKLYELLLEGALLGREVCGGGVGMSLQNGIVMLSTTIPLRHCRSSALKDIMPCFVETLARWRSLVDELVS